MFDQDETDHRKGFRFQIRITDYWKCIACRYVLLRRYSVKITHVPLPTTHLFFSPPPPSSPSPPPPPPLSLTAIVLLMGYRTQEEHTYVCCISNVCLSQTEMDSLQIDTLKVDMLDLTTKIFDINIFCHSFVGVIFLFFLPWV